MKQKLNLLLTLAVIFSVCFAICIKNSSTVYADSISPPFCSEPLELQNQTSNICVNPGGLCIGADGGACGINYPSVSMWKISGFIIGGILVLLGLILALYKRRFIPRFITKRSYVTVMLIGLILGVVGSLADFLKLRTAALNDNYTPVVNSILISLTLLPTTVLFNYGLIDSFFKKKYLNVALSVIGIILLVLTLMLLFFQILNPFRGG